MFASTQSAEAASSFELPFNELEIENFVLRVSRPRGRRRIDSSAIGEARRFGGELFKALFRGEIHGLYHDALAGARSHDRGVRITLCLSQAPELIDIPWEYLFDDPDFLAVSALTPVVRYLDLPRAHRPLAVKPPIRLLGVVSSPAEHEALDVGRERSNLHHALSGLSEAGAIELHWLERPTLGALLRALQAETFHALHFIGHGTYDRDTEQGVLLFEDDGGWARPVSGDKLGMILHDFSSLRLAVLNACEGARAGRTDAYAGVAGSLVQRDIPAVVAMQFEISDEAAIVFASGFYQPLAAGSPVDASVGSARLAMLAERGDDIEWGTPVLFMRVPDGRIFDLGDRREATAADVRARSPEATVSRIRAAEDSRRPPRIFINYRPEDTAADARLLYERLEHRFGRENVFLDVELGPGTDWLQVVRSSGSDDAAFLALIGPRWVPGLRGRRASGISESDDDLVRREIEWALRDWPGVVIPVLVGATMPDALTLPRSVRGLCRKQPAELRHASFDRDVAGLIERLERIGGGDHEAVARMAPTPGNGSRRKPASAVVTRTPGAASGVPAPDDHHYADVIDGMVDGTTVPVLGSRVRGALPDTDQLAAYIAKKFNVERDSENLAEVAQYVAVTRGERRLYTTMREVFASEAEPTAVHRFLAAFPGLLRDMNLPPQPQMIVSTNYDLALERAFEEANEPFDYALYLPSSGWFVHFPWGEHDAEPLSVTITEPHKYGDFPINDDGELERTVIVKIHGSTDAQEGALKWVNNYVVTEDQYIDYLPTDTIHRLVPVQILDKLKSSRCLFLGYPMRDWNARVFLRRIWRGESISEKSWAIEERPDVLEKDSWGLVGHVELLAASVPEYVGELWARALAMKDAPS